MSTYDINLLTREEKQEQVKVKVVKFGTIISIFLLIVVGGITAYFFSKASGLKASIKEEEQKITNMRASIQSMESTEVTARNLYQKYTAINDIFTQRVYNSFLLEHFNSKIPAGVSVASFSFRGASDIDISGEAPSYVSVSDFLKNLNAKEEKQVFTSATLTNVTLNAADRSVKYVIVLGFNKEVLKLNE